MDQSPEERRDALFECIEELTGREFPRNQFPQQSDKYPDEANEAIRSLSDVLGAINSRNRGQMLSKMLTELEEEGADSTRKCNSPSGEERQAALDSVPFKPSKH